MSLRALVLGCLLGLGLVSACTTTLENTRIPTATQLFLSPIPLGSSTSFTCVRGAEYLGSTAPFSRTCLDPSATDPLGQWGVLGCTRIANFCQDSSQLNSYLQTPTSGAVLAESRNFTCQPGHQIYYTRASVANPTVITTETFGETSIQTTCLAISRDTFGLAISQESGLGLFAVDRGDAVAVPYCFPKPNLCPSSQVQYANDMLTAAQQLQFSNTAAITLNDAFGASMGITTTTYLNAPGNAACQFGFLSGHPTSDVLCKIDASGNGYWVYTDAPTTNATCVRRTQYCDTVNSDDDLTNFASITTFSTSVEVSDAVLVVCNNGFAAYSDNRESNIWEARCTPDTATEGKFLVNSDFGLPGPYSFPADFSGDQPCSPIWGFCDTRTQNQSPNVAPWDYNSFDAGTLENQGTIGDSRLISCTEGAVWTWGGTPRSSLELFTCREAYASYFLSPASDRAKYGYWIPDGISFTSVADLPSCEPILNLCGGTYPLDKAEIKTSSSGSGSAITGAYAVTQVSTPNYYYDCDAGYSVGGTTTSAIPQVFCHATVVDTTTFSYYNIVPGTGVWSTNPDPIDMQDTTSPTSTSWSLITSAPTIVEPTCTLITGYCPTADLTSVPGTITTPPLSGRSIDDVATRVCADGYYPSSLSPPAAYEAAFVTENLICKPIPSDTTGQTGRWVQSPSEALLGPCDKSPFYCPARNTWSSANNWKTESTGTTTIDSSFNPICLDGYTIDSAGAKTAPRTLTVTCSVETSIRGCWKSGGTCNPQCTIVPDYCVAPQNVTVSVASQVGATPSWTCVSGYTANGLPAALDGSNVQTDSTCVPLVSDSTNQEGRLSTLLYGSDWKGCSPADNFCSLSGVGVDTPIVGRVNGVTDFSCTLGYKLQCQGAPGGAPLAAPQRSITGAVCLADTPIGGTWRHPSDPTNCKLECVRITDFCPPLVITAAGNPLGLPNQAPPSDGNELLSTTNFWCPLGYAAAAGVAPTTPPTPVTPSVTRATAAGPITTATEVLNPGSPIYRTATCVAVPSAGTPTTVSGQWEVNGAYPGCAVVTDFCTAATFPNLTGPLIYTATVKSGGNNPPGSAVNPAAGTATYDEIIFSRCINGYAKDFFPVTTGGGFESKFLGTERSDGYEDTNGAYRCDGDGNWEFIAALGSPPGPNLCDPVQLCDLPTHPSLAFSRCEALVSPCPFETDGRFFCSNGYLTQPAANPGWYDIAPAARLTSGIAAVFDLTCSTALPAVIPDATVPSGLTWTGFGGTDWVLTGGGTEPTYQYSQRWLMATTQTNPTTVCEFQQNYCSLLGPFQSRFLANVDTLTTNAGTRAHNSILNLMRCKTGYEIAYGNFAQQASSPRAVERTGLICRPNSEAVSPPILAGEWSLIQTTTVLPAQCVPIEGFCQFTNPTSFGTFTAPVQTVGSIGSYCCQPGYKLSTSAATSTSVTCTAPSGPAPSTWLQNGQWLAGGVAPACVPITDYCSVGAVTTTSTPLRVDSISPTDIFGSRTFSCSAGYQIDSGVYSRSYACTATDSNCGGASTGSFLSAGIAPSCTVIDDYCPSVRLAGTSSNTIGLRVGESSQVSCDLGFSVTGSSSATPLAYTCAAGTSSTGTYTGNPQCLISTDYCSANSVSLNVPSIQSLTSFGQRLGDRGFLTCDAAGYGIGGARGSNSVAVECVTNPSSPAFGKWVDPNGVDVSATTCSASNNTCLLTPLGTGTLSANATGTTDQYATLTCPTGSTIGGTLSDPTSALVRCNAGSPTGWVLFGSQPLTLPTCSQVPQWCPSTAAYNAANPGSTLTAAAPFFFGTSGSVACSNGYFSPNPATVVSCLANRTWQAPSCILVTGYCPVSSLGPLAAPVPTNARLAENRSVSCAIGYQFISGAFQNIPVTCAASTASVGVFKDSTGTDALCGPVASYCPSSVANGVVALAIAGVSEVGSQGVMNCDLGSSINNGSLTSITVTCNAFNRVVGSWNQSSGAATSCTIIERFCGPVQVTGSTQVTAASARYLDTYSLVCDAGFYGLGTNNVLNTLTCSRVTGNVLAGQWTVGGAAWGGCVPIPNYCPSNVTAFKATLSQSPLTGFVGSQAQFNCTAGTTSTGVKTASTLLDVECGTSGTWVVGGSPTSGCQTVIDYCSTSGTVRSGVFANPLGGALNQVNQFDCSLGYIVSSTNTANSIALTCDVSGSWFSGGSVFSGCVLNPNFCPNVVEANAVVNSTNGNALGSGALVTCNPGYTGDGGRVCGPNGQWSATITCVDLNECLQVGACTSTQVCNNTDGSYSCTECADNNTVVRANVCVCQEPIWVPGPAGCECACGLNALCSEDLAGNPVCVCPTGFVVNSTTGDCSPCGNLGEQCCAAADSCGNTGLICQLGFCQNPPVPAPTVINVTQTPSAVPVPAATPTGRTPAPSPSNTNGGGSSSADDAASLSVLFALAFQLL